jgi:hypothetical protein
VNDDPVPLVDTEVVVVVVGCCPVPAAVDDEGAAPLFDAPAVVVEVVDVLVVFGACSAPATGDRARTDTAERSATPMAPRPNLLAPVRRSVLMAVWINTILGASLILRPRRIL